MGCRKPREYLIDLDSVTDGLSVPHEVARPELARSFQNCLIGTMHHLLSLPLSIAQWVGSLVTSPMSSLNDGAEALKQLHVIPRSPEPEDVKRPIALGERSASQRNVKRERVNDDDDVVFIKGRDSQ